MYHATKVDRAALVAYRLGRLRAELRRQDVAAILLYDPINIRYATDTANMQVWTLHNAVRYCLVPTEGPVTLFDFHNCEHLSAGAPAVAETRPGTSWYFFGAGPHVEARARRWAAELADLVRAHGGGNRRLAVDKVNFVGARALEAEGLTLCEGEEACERARSIKSADEIVAMRESIAVCEEGMRRMQAALVPGITENALWSVLHQTNIQLGGEWIETRLLASGPRTNPWFQECADRVIHPGELVSFDTDLIGPNGYCADLSRSWLCGGMRPSDGQRRLYGMARAQIEHNMALLRPGVSFRELSERAFPLPEAFRPNRYSVLFHGVGLVDEYPGIVYAEDFERGGYDGMVEAGMTLCVESYVGEAGGAEGVKLEQQVLVTESGATLLSGYPLEDAWA